MALKCDRKWRLLAKGSHPGHIVPANHLSSILSSILLALSLWIAPISGAAAIVTAAPSASANDQITPLGADLQLKLSHLSPQQMTSVIVILKTTTVLPVAGQGKSQQERVIRALHTQAVSAQMEIKGFLQQSRFSTKIGRILYYWIINGFSLEATPEVIRALSARPEVDHILANEVIQASTPQATPGIPWDNLGKINAPLLWATGFYGQGVVVANMDTGVDYTHPELSAQWRGGSNSWYDPADPPGTHPTPVDLPAACGSIAGHGTGTMSVMVGKTVGVAPQAKWIAVKIFDDICLTDASKILDGFQWILDPDQDPMTADAPQIVNNSWGAPGCDTVMMFQTALQNLRAAGILPVFSAGNAGPAAESSNFPGNYPEAFAVGATDKVDLLAAYSSRGPNTCVAPPVDSTYPAIVAPGTDIMLASPGGGYGIGSGTSFAAPHVAGALALLLSAFPDRPTVQWQEAALKTTAMDLGTMGPDDLYGYGRLDVWAAYQSYREVTVKTGSASIMEDGVSLPVLLSLDQSPLQPVTLSFSTIGGTATGNGVDYTLPTPVTFYPCAPCTTDDLQKGAQISIKEDTIPETDETFQVNVTSSGGVVSIPQPLILGTILDNDATVGFSASSQTVDQSAGSATLTIIRSGGLSLPVSVDYLVSSGTAILGQDYILPAGRIDFASGGTQKTIPITLLNNSKPGLSSTVELMLTDPQGASLSPDSSQMVLTILHSTLDKSLYIPIIFK